MTDQEKALKELVSYRDRLGKIDYDDVKILINESLKKIPVATAKLKKNTPIDRVRLNREKPFFYCQDDLSYMKNQDDIKKYLTKFGRANKPHQPVFYGALESSEIGQNRVTAIYETSDLLNDTKSICLDGQLFTLSRWITSEELIVAEIVFADEALIINSDIKKSFDHHFESLKNHPSREFVLRQLQFFSNEYARKINSHHDYKISAAYSDIIMNKFGLAGIAYPSVQTRYKGQNLVLRTDIVDKHLELNAVGTFRLHKNKERILIANYYNTMNFGENNANFQWNLSEPDEQKIIKESIKDISTL